MEWIGSMTRFTRALGAVAGRVDSSELVPSCPEWTVDDLLWHLLEVQHFWTHVISTRPDSPSAYTQLPRAGLTTPTMLIDGCERLAAVLASADPTDAAWSWAVDQTVGFTLRRQAHEAFIHLIDGLQTVIEPMPEVDAEFAADGVDEIVGFFAAEPSWATFTPSDETIKLRTSEFRTEGVDHAGDADDAGTRTWLLQFGRRTGTSNRTNEPVDEDAVVLTNTASSASSAPAALVSAKALDLDLWLWGRAQNTSASATSISTTGDPTLVDRLRSIALSVTR